MTSELPFDPERKEFLRQQLADLLERHQSRQVPLVELVENLLVVLLAAVDDGTARRG
jgi:hypothetical protein